MTIKAMRNMTEGKKWKAQNDKEKEERKRRMEKRKK